MKHYNPSITERANRIFNLKNGDQMPDEVEGPVAVIPLTNVVRIVRSASANNAASGTVWTTPAEKDFYLTGVILTTTKDATSTATNIQLTAFIDGVGQPIVRIRGITLTAMSQTVPISFSVPIKIDRNTQINIANDSAVANIATSAVIFGYTEEVART